MSVDVLKLGKRNPEDFSPMEITDYRLNGPMKHYHNRPGITNAEVAEDMARAEISK